MLMAVVVLAFLFYTFVFSTTAEPLTPFLIAASVEAESVTYLTRRVSTVTTLSVSATELGFYYSFAVTSGDYHNVT